MEILEYNRQAWDHQVEKGNPWTVPVTPEMVVAARHGHWKILLTPSKPVPRHWFPANLRGKEILCLASGGGQQGPILAATGARVTVLDLSPLQLERDRVVAERDGLEIKTVLGDMADLSMFPDGCFDMIFNPVSTVFIPDVRPVWRESFRVLRSRGTLLAGLMNPALYIFDVDLMDRTGQLRVKYKLPYSDFESLNDNAKQRYMVDGIPFEFSHTLEDLIAGQMEAGFFLIGFYEDRYPPEAHDPLSQHMPVCFATRAVKP